ncbi:Putative steryl acetyl hydrolase mug81 [Psilocybe cubensis]|uniref:Alpha/beta hydrolase fold-3 domain-containing protein n=2 Tax=Psilocybe cubensis TaxID=181762 RepID=A0A8H8CFJ1_PSICU|nr:Putative steryl acetyl hydrolase mug81 [Psilocybe cubensis]KAH9475180.1 Putative steryl acetyl hydrolase mug81 [Psilocybe cubensis]
MAIQTRRYGFISWWERIYTLVVLFPLPLITLYRLAIFNFLPSERHKRWQRVLGDASFRYISSSLSVNQMQNLMGTTLDVYRKFAKANSLPIVIDELDDDTRLLWFGERQFENIVFYVHGGTYCLPLQDFAASFWKYTIEELRNRTNKNIGFVALNYSLIPTAYFPTQLKQTVIAVQHLISKGVKPENIQMAGESAGGALILQLFSHILHPVPGVPLLPKGIQFASACIMSPWVTLTADSGSHAANSDKDVLPASAWAYLGQQSLPSVSSTTQAYLEALKAPEGWFEGIDCSVQRILITVGENECLRDDVLEVARKLSSTRDDRSVVTTIVHKNGVHNDQYLDFMSNVTPGDLTPQIIQWLQDGLGFSS